MGNRNIFMLKSDQGTYFKCFDKTGSTYTTINDNPMIFFDKKEATIYNGKSLYGMCSVTEVKQVNK